MIGFVRVGLFAALAILLSFSNIAAAADKAFQRDDLKEAAVRLEGEIKTQAGQVGKPVAQLRRELDAAFQKNDYRNGMVLLGQIVATAPDDTATWLRLARTILQIGPRDERERTFLLERAATAAYIAYTRTSNRAEEAEALTMLGRSFAERQIWRPAIDSYRLALDLREVAEVRGQYERLRDEHGFRLLD